jgi:hypothetical protein
VRSYTSSGMIPLVCASFKRTNGSNAPHRQF